MIKLKKEVFFSPLGIFFAYILVSGLAIMGFRLIFPGEAAPLDYFSLPWRLIRGFLDYLGLFPALVLSSLVIPFGFTIQRREKIDPFSPRFLQSLKMSIVTAVVGAALFGLLFSLVLPLARDYETNMRFQGRLYGLAEERARESAASENWTEAARFIAVCERIWPEGPDVSKLKIEADIHTEEELISPLEPPESGSAVISAPGFEPVNAAEALALAESALTEERYFDAHWLATLGGRLAKADSVESDAALRLAGRAWNGVNSLAPNARETGAHTVYRLKREGYQALLAEKWIEAYYTFRDLLALSPEDPDAERYLALSEDGLRQEAFFIDEVELAVGKIITGAVFSLPLRPGRLVMRVSTLSIFTDSAYGMGIEILAFDPEGRPLWNIKAPYAKFLPLSRNSGPGLSVLMRALAREDKTKYWEPETGGQPGENSSGYVQGQLALSVSWDDFLLLADIHRGFSGGKPQFPGTPAAGSGLSPAALLRAAENPGDYGYQPQVFEAELLRRFVEPLFLLPFGILAVVMGWRYRAFKRPRYMGIPMLGILPLVFNGAIYFFRGWISDLGIFAVVSLGFTFAAVVFGIGITVLLVLSLIILAAQHG